MPVILVIAGRPLLRTLAGLDEAAAAAVAPLLAVALYWLYETLTTAQSGQTWGKRFAGVRVVDGDGHPPDLGRSAVRALPVILVGLPLLWLLAPLSYIWAAVSPDGRGLHDRAAGTHVERLPWLPATRSSRDGGTGPPGAS